MTSSLGKIKLTILFVFFSMNFSDNLSAGTRKSRRMDNTFYGGMRSNTSLTEKRNRIDEQKNIDSEKRLQLMDKYTEKVREAEQAIKEYNKISDDNVKAKGKKGENLTRLVEQAKEHMDSKKEQVKETQKLIKYLNESIEGAAAQKEALKGPGGFVAKMGAAGYLGVVGSDNFEVLVENEIWAPNSTITNIGAAIALKGGDSLGKSIDRIVQDGLGDSFERVSISFFSSLEKFIGHYWRRLVKWTLELDGEPFDHRQVYNFGEIICGSLDDYIRICKDARRFDDRDKKSRLQEIEFGETISKIKTVISELSDVPLENMRSNSKLSELGITDENWESFIRKLESDFEVEFEAKALEDIATLKDVTDLVLVDPDWKYERDNKLHNIKRILDYMDVRITYYKRDKDSMEYRYGSMVREGLAEFSQILSQTKSDKDLGTGTFHRRLRRLHSSLKRSFSNLLKYIPGAKRREDEDAFSDQGGRSNGSRGRSRLGGGFLGGDDMYDDY